VNVAVVLHARTEGFLGMQAILTPMELERGSRGGCPPPRALPRGLRRHLPGRNGCLRAAHASVALAPASERFHWLTAPRSDVLQASPVHGGMTHDPAVTLERLFREQVLGG
jgi:hypothetical protein